MGESARRIATRRGGALPLAAALAAALVAALVVSLGGIAQARGLPRLVFVARRSAMPGHLMVRETDGRLHPLLPRAPFEDVSHPVVSWDGTRIVFAARGEGALLRSSAPRGVVDDAWRIWVVGADGTGLARVTSTDRVLDLAPLGAGADRLFARYDDRDPAWLPDGRIVFSSTRFPQIAQRGRLAVPNLFVVRADGTGLERLTTERNGAVKPAVDPATGRVVYARWFFNPYLASDSTATGLTMDPALAVPHEHVDLWQAVSIFPDGDRIQLAGGDPRSHDSSACYAPCPLADGTLVGVRAPAGTLPPSIAGGELVAYAGGVGPGRVLARAGTPRDSSVAQEGGVQSPVALPDGRVLFALDRAGDGDLGLYAVSPRGGALERIVDEKGTRELDPCPLVKRKTPPVLAAQGGIDDPAWLLPVTTLPEAQRMDDTFRFDCLNVFASGPVDAPTPSAPRLEPKVRIRFFAALARPFAATGDTLVLVREARVTPAGGVHESDMPGDVPMFEQLVDSLGHVLMSAHGPAHVPGSNFARIGSGTKCVGCHAGHSTLPVPKNYHEARWFNAAPSAAVTATSVRPGAAPPSALVDRVAKGPIARVGWVSDGVGAQSARLSWATPIEARAFVLYAPWSDGGSGTDVKIRSATLVLYRHGQEVGRVRVGAVRPAGTRVDVAPIVIDAVEVHPVATGAVDRRPAVALAEVETIARLPE